MKYGGDLKMSFPVQQTAQRVIPTGDADCCQFVLLDMNRVQHACNAPATKMRRNGFRYCDAHAEQVQRDCKRRGKIIELIPFKGKL
jgi:hypothetical protein